ncbi:hypothetical protein Nepgr_002158 [Nepenthes gracilis]|uniref:TOD1/MUCI70 glycosyltransferase-like domain-containing protein n=1 Tax=Nepenthes gracilis TaxID=150966 RepID=A0AAD3RXK9_NEPGR|nr:hypothetical protein Nepgr_002158 [Nepenthes gracilis]
MAQYRQSGFDRSGVQSHDQKYCGNGGSEHVSIGIRAPHKQPRMRRLGHKSRKISIGTVVLILCLVLAVSALAIVYLPRDKGINTSNGQDDEFKNDQDFLSNVSRINTAQVKFGHGSVAHGRDSRYWDGDDRRRDEDYNEDVVDKGSMANRDETGKGRVALRGKNASRKTPSNNMMKGTNLQGFGLYNEAGRNDLKMYEEKYEASLKNAGQSNEENEEGDRISHDGNSNMENEDIDIDDEYDYGIDSHDDQMEEYEEIRHENEANSDLPESHSENISHLSYNAGKTRNITNEVDGEVSNESLWVSSDNVNAKSGQANIAGRSTVKSSSHRRSASRKKVKHHKFSASTCDLKFLNSTAQLVEPPESRKFARFSLQYTAIEQKPAGVEQWEPRFAGHQSFREREESFIARDQKINCGFVKGPKGYPSTGFDLGNDDARYMSRCHIAVASCIFGNSDRLRSPTGKTVTRLSRKNVCFVMFMDPVTLETLTLEGQMPDRMGFIGLWKIVIVKNLPYSDMRRVGKIPKLLSHRLFTSARYSIWLDSKLRLQHDPLLILEYFLWRKGHEYAISNHYDRHCVWEEVAQNKKLNKYNHTIIDQQFAFYQADGLKRFNASDPNKMLPSNVPEGSFIIRAHTPMSNLFSCLWFNEVDRFTPRDQLSFAYTYQKLRKKNPGKPFHLNMFKDCERRAIAKLFHHRSEENHVHQEAAG